MQSKENLNVKSSPDSQGTSAPPAPLESAKKQGKRTASTPNNLGEDTGSRASENQHIAEILAEKDSLLKLQGEQIDSLLQELEKLQLAFRRLTEIQEAVQAEKINQAIEHSKQLELIKNKESEIIALKNKLECEQADFLKTNTNHEAEKSTLKKNLTEKKSEIENLTQQIEHQSEKQEQLQKSLDTSNQKLEAWQTKSISMEQEISKKSQELNKRDDENKTLTTQLHQTQEELSNLHLRIKEINDNHHKNLSQAETQIGHLKVQHENEKSALTRELAIKISEIEQQAQQIKALSSKQKDLENLNQEAKKSQEVQQKELAHLKTQLEQKNIDLDNLKKADQEKIDALALLQKTHSSLVAELGDCKDKLANAISENIHKTALLKEQEGKLQAQENSLTTLREEQEKQRKEAGNLQDLLTTLEKRTSETEAENELLLTQLFLVQEELERYFLENRENLALLDQYKSSLQTSRLRLAKFFMPNT